MGNTSSIVKPTLLTHWVHFTQLETFDFIPDAHMRYMLISAYHTITRLEKWQYLREYVVDPEKGFIFTREETIDNLMTEIENDYRGHSGASMGLTMRHMEFLANQGLYQFRKLWDSERGSRVEQITSTNTRATHDIDDDDIDDDDNTIII